MYKNRFENIFRVAKKLTSSLNIGDVLEIIRDEARNTIPQLQEACLLVIDPDAQYYTRPLHCAVEKQRVNCQLCKRGRGTITSALSGEGTAMCFLPGQRHDQSFTEANLPDGLSEIVIPIYKDDKPLAVLDAIAANGTSLGKKELVLLKDLAELATNVINNARSHWKISQEKLTLDKILGHLKPFVPSTVQKIVETDPNAPLLDKKDTDVTILFLDIAGYTRISETHTREKVNFIIEKFFSSFLDILYSHGGDINETAGDGLMVIFQGPTEKTAMSAATAALEIRGKTLEINEELENRFQPVEINMGLNSGVASLGMSRFEGSAGTRMTFTATGPVTNLAARIAGSATHGDILVGPTTAKYIAEEIVLHDRGLMQFKNVKDLVQVYSLVREKDEAQAVLHTEVTN
jgi:class 3 adenylate cyclase